MASDDPDQPAGLEYHGIPGATKPCVDAIVRLLQGRWNVKSARIVSLKKKHTNEHALLLKNDVGDEAYIKAGFGSGYGGTGSRGFSLALALLEQHGAEIDECWVSAEVMERSHYSALTNADCDAIRHANANLPRHLEYMTDCDFNATQDGTLWRQLLPIVPLAVIDRRLADLAISFWSAPDDRLRKGYTMLEDIVRERTGLTSFGTQLFSDAFLGDTARLTWNCNDKGEITGRGTLFTGAAKAHRNPRSHRDLKTDYTDALSELLLLNHLFRLESDAIATPPRPETS
jgi:hypothetical protein